LLLDAIQPYGFSIDKQALIALEIIFVDGQNERMYVAIPAGQARNFATARQQRDRSANSLIQSVQIRSWS